MSSLIRGFLHEITSIFVLTLGAEPSKQGPRLIFGKLRRVYHVITYWQHSWEISNKYRTNFPFVPVIIYPVTIISWVQIPYGPEFFSGPIFNYSFQQCSQLRGSLNFISSPQCKYMNFIYLKSSFITWMVYLACQLNWQSAAPASQRSWVQIPYGPEFFSGPIFNYYFSSVLSCEDLLNSFLHHTANI